MSWSAKSLFARVRPISSLRSWTFAFSRFARLWSTACRNGVGSSSARGWPFLTTELKSTWSFAMMPETWLPTLTVVTADSVPVAVTVAIDVALVELRVPVFRLRGALAGEHEPRASPRSTTMAATAARILFFMQSSTGVGRRQSRKG